MSHNDPSDDRDIVSKHVKDFVRSGERRTSDELAGSLGAIAGFARGGLAGGLAGAFLMPIAEGAGHTVAKAIGLEKDDEDGSARNH
jgi:hypothetical protein